MKIEDEFFFHYFSRGFIHFIDLKDEEEERCDAMSENEDKEVKSKFHFMSMSFSLLYFHDN
jgi:hypothetical protein